jgi:hypothetical protein
LGSKLLQVLQASGRPDGIKGGVRATDGVNTAVHALDASNLISGPREGKAVRAAASLSLLGLEPGLPGDVSWTTSSSALVPTSAGACRSLHGPVVCCLGVVASAVVSSCMAEVWPLSTISQSI